MSQSVFLDDEDALASPQSAPARSSMVTLDELEPQSPASWAGPEPRWGVAEEIGARQSLEDANLCAELGEQPNHPPGPAAFYAVFDGHGGADAAAFAREHLLGSVTAQAGWAADVPASLRAAFQATDEALRGAVCGSCGTTALAALLLGRTLWVANAGDSRCVLSRRGRALELSSDHKPGSAREQARISASGGFVDGEGYLNGVVGVSRALGDWAMLSASPSRDKRLKLHPDEPCYPGPLSGECEVRVHELSCEDEFFILACDGLWDVLSSQAAVELARQSLRGHNDVQRLAEELVKEAIARHSGDNVTVLVVALSPLPPPARPPPLRCSASASRLFSRTISNEALADVQRLLNGEGEGEGSGRSGSGAERALAALEEGKLAALSLS